MASQMSLIARYRIAKQQLNLETADVKMVLMRSDFEFDPTKDYMSDFSAYELNVPGYTRGFGGAGRKALTNKSMTLDKQAGLVRFSSDSPIDWGNIGPGETVGGALMIVEGTSDADSIVVAWIDANDIITNGGAYSLQMNATAGAWLTF